MKTTEIHIIIKGPAAELIERAISALEVRRLIADNLAVDPLSVDVEFRPVLTP